MPGTERVIAFSQLAVKGLKGIEVCNRHTDIKYRVIGEACTLTNRVIQ
jgi:hypothetical protein